MSQGVFTEKRTFPRNAGQPRISGKLTGSPLRSEEGAREKTLLKLHFPKIAGRARISGKRPRP